MKWTVQSAEELKKVAEYVVSIVCKVPRTEALVLGLYGNLGAGKTTFTKELVAALGGMESVVSPTFILERDYTVSNNYNIKTLAHIDAYRFEEQSEAQVLRVDNRLVDPTLFYVIEWPEKMGVYMPAHHKLIFTHEGGDARTLMFEILLTDTQCTV